MDKLLSYPGKTEQGINTFVIEEEKGYLEKTASQYNPVIAAYIADAKRIPGVTQLLITALGAGEYWGDNTNADWFGESQLAHEGPDYGFKTFETLAKVFKHHINKPDSPAYGKVFLSVYNPVYHRVELITGVNHRDAPDVVANIENGVYPVWSMGCLRKDAKLLNKDHRFVRISDIKSGDEVINAKGEAVKVAYPHSHHHKGTWYEVQALGFPRGLEPTTEEHPWFICPAEEAARHRARGCGAIAPVWKRAEELKVGDYVATPIIQDTSSGFSEDVAAYRVDLELIEGRFIEGGYLWSPIQGIKTSVCDETVYNIAIETGDYDSDSYIVNNVALHNCKIPYDVCNVCGNRAPTRKQYCSHLRYQLGQIDPSTGKKVYAINLRPRFFDISMVTVPADRTAMTHKKVAFAHTTPGGIIVSSAELAEKAAATYKEAEIDKEIPVSGPPASQSLVDDPRARELSRTIVQMHASEPSIPNRVLDRMSLLGGLPEILSTMASCLILPKPREFQRIFLISQGMRQLADQLDTLNACFDPMMHSGAPTQNHLDMLKMSPDRVRMPIADELSPFFESRSYAAPILNRRLTVLVKQASYDHQDPVFVDPSTATPGSNILPILGLGAALYAALNTHIGKTAFEGLLKMVTEHPGFALAAGIGAIAGVKAMDQGAANMPRGRFTSAPDLPNEGNSIYDRYERMRAKPYIKIGAGESEALSRARSVASRLLIGVPAAYAASGILQTHKNFNPQDTEGRVSHFIRSNPNVVAGALGADAVLAAGGKGTHQLTKHVYPLVKKLVKKANDTWLDEESIYRAAGIVED